MWSQHHIGVSNLHIFVCYKPLSIFGSYICVLTYIQNFTVIQFNSVKINSCIAQMLFTYFEIRIRIIFMYSRGNRITFSGNGNTIDERIVYEVCDIWKNSIVCASPSGSMTTDILIRYLTHLVKVYEVCFDKKLTTAFLFCIFDHCWII